MASVLAFQALDSWLSTHSQDISTVISGLSRSPPRLWAELWRSLKRHSYTSRHCAPLLAFTGRDLAAFGAGFGRAWDEVPDGAAEKMFQV